MWKKNQLGEIQRVGDVPTGVTQNMPSTWSGWGTEWQQSPQYNPTTQRMDQVYNKSPMDYEGVLAQGKVANLPGSWLDNALGNRTLQASEQKYLTDVPETVGRLVHAKQGYDSRYDLQGGTSAMGVTPAGYYDVSQNPMAWQQGYGQAYGGTGSGEGGGYKTGIASWQDYMGWTPSQQQQMGAWFDSGMADYTQEDYVNELQKYRAPERFQGVTYR
jgi:hypothetical protein